MSIDKVNISFQKHTKPILALKCETILIYRVALYAHGNRDPPNSFF